MKSLIFVGDSNLDQYVTNDQKFGTIVGAKLGYPVVICDGKSGQGAEALNARFAVDVVAKAPQAVGIMIGTNNLASAYENNVSNPTMLASYIAAVADCIDKAKAVGITPFIISPPPARLPEMCLRFEPTLTALKALCVSKGITYANIYDAIADQARNVSKTAFNSLYFADPDKYHLVVAGHTFVAGCIDWASVIPPPDLSSLANVLNATHDASFGNVTGGTFRVVINQSAMSAAGPSGFARLRLQAHADESFVVQKLYAGVPSSGASASSIVPVRVNGSTSFTIPQGQSVWTDAFVKPGSGLVVSGYCNGGTSADKLSAKTGVSGVTTYYASSDHAADLSVTVGAGNFLGYSGYLSLVSEIQTDGA